jgi:hypothetical protein
MDPISTVVLGCLAYGGYKLYTYASSPIYHYFAQPVSQLEGTPVYNFDLTRAPDGYLNINGLTSNAILSNKPQLVDAIKVIVPKYQNCNDINSFVFYYGEIPLLKLGLSKTALTNVIVRLPPQPSSGSFTIFNHKQYHFEGPIQKTYDVDLKSDGSLDISKHLILHNYPLIVEAVNKATFVGVSEVIFTYYNIPLIKLNINGQEDKLFSVVMDLA